MIELLGKLATILSENVWLGLPISFIAGVVTSFTPCSLSGVPLVIGCASGYGENRKLAFFYSLIFCAGLTVVFVIIGIIVSLAGSFFVLNVAVVNIILGVFTAIMALQIWGVIKIIPNRCGYKKVDKSGAVGAFLTGMLAALVASPCATPVLGAILAVTALEGSLVFGALMLLLYSIGHSVLLVVAGTTVGFSKQIASNEKLQKASKVFNAILGVLIFMLSLYLLYSGFYVYR